MYVFEEESKNNKRSETGKKMATALVSKVTSLLKPVPRDTRALNPAKELSETKMSAVKEFLTLFRLKRDELHVELQRLTEALTHSSYDNPYGQSMLAEKQKKEYLLVMVNMFLFHAHILLRKSDDRKLVTSDEKQQLKDFFFKMLQVEKEYLPAEFSLKVFFKYLMYKEAFLFLFFRGEYERLLTLIHD